MAANDWGDTYYGSNPTDPNQELYQDKAFRQWAQEQAGRQIFSSFNGIYSPVNQPGVYWQGQSYPAFDASRTATKLANEYRMYQENQKRQRYVDAFNTNQRSIDPNTAFQKSGDYYIYAGLPVRQDAKGNWFYDAATIAQGMGYSPDQAAQLNNPEWAYNFAGGLETDARKYAADYKGTFGGDLAAEGQFVSDNLSAFGGTNNAGAFLRNLARTPVVLGTGPDLSNSTMVGNIAQGRTGLNYQSFAGNPILNQEKNLFYKPDPQHWYNIESLIPMITLTGMSLIGGGIAGTLAGPLAAGAGTAVGGGATGSLVSGAITGGAAGLGGAVPSAFAQTGAGDIGGALKTLGTGTLGGAAVGGLAGGIAGNVSSSDPMQHISFDSIPDSDPIKRQMIDMAREMGTTPQNILDITANLDTLQQIQNAGLLGAEGTSSIFGLAGGSSPDTSVPFDKISNINDPANTEQYIKDLYTTGNTETLSALGFMTDTGAGLGLSPSNLALPGEATPSQNPIDKKNLLARALQLLGGGNETPPAGPTGFTNEMFTPISPSVLNGLEGIVPNLGSNQAAALGQQGGSTNPEYFTQQYEKVRPVQESYAQSLLSMAQADPTILENPQVLEMLKSELEGGGGQLVQYGLKRPLSLEGLV